MPSECLAMAAHRLAPLYGKRRGVMVATGMAALELALELVGVNHDDEVVVPSECCYLVPAAVRRVGAHPVFAPVDERLTLDPDATMNVVGPLTRALVAVHHLGLPCPVALLRERLPPKIALIEDAAQAFDIRSMGHPVGLCADLVAVSFGAGKPLSLDGGGALFGDREDVPHALARHGSGWREGTILPRAYALHPRAVDHLEEAISQAKIRVAQRRENVARASERLEAIGFEVWQGRDGDQPVWHRLPVWANSTQLWGAALAADKAGEIVQSPHVTRVPELPLFSGVSSSPRGASARQPFLLRTDCWEVLDRWIRRVSEWRKVSA